MEYKIRLANGTEINATLEVADVKELGAKLNQDDIRALTIGTFSIAKNALLNIVPVSETGNVEITTSDNQRLLIQDDKYNATNYSAQINSGVQFCVFGNSIIGSRNYFMARPLN